MPLALKLKMLESVVMSKIQHHFPNTYISEELLQGISETPLQDLHRYNYVHFLDEKAP